MAVRNPVRPIHAGQFARRGPGIGNGSVFETAQRNGKGHQQGASGNAAGDDRCSDQRLEKITLAQSATLIDIAAVFPARAVS